MQVERKINILLVDDYPTNLFLLEAMLGNLGHNLVKATSGKEALEYVVNQDFALILLDIQMPKLDGFETAKLIRQHLRSQHTPIIFITAFHNNLHKVLQGYSFGAVDYLVKPIVPEILISKVKEFVELFRQTQKIKQQHDLLELANQELKNEVIQHQQTQQALLLTQQRLQYLLFHSPSVIYCCQPFGDFATTFVSENISEKLGYTVQDVKEDSKFWVKHIHPSDRPHIVDKLPLLLKNSTQTYEYRFLHSDSKYRWIRDEIKLIHDAEGNPLEIVGSMMDITERKQVEESLCKALEKEKELNELKSRFVSLISHEFRTPLTTILGANELLTHYHQRITDEKKLIYLQRIHNNVKHLTQMLDDVLLLGKAEAGKLEVKTEHLDLVQLCRSLTDEFQIGTGNTHQLLFTSNSQSTYIEMDEYLLRHILGNLLSNAIKYSPTDSAIDFKLTCEDEAARFQIQDWGIGISAEDQLKLFESFHRGTNAGKVAGTGLGLAIVKKAVDLLGGDIVFNSQLNVGTTFTVTIPLKKET
ncbi:MAG: response regulator [Scytonema sp. PMC 1069.18]|nr:response regulator [Scytonema sp. PMC 1069.18]MEC4886292.1 response regulator [Scytonema sp. PMC 1070.18]